jgi:hypothetical protein
VSRSPPRDDWAPSILSPLAIDHPGEPPCRGSPSRQPSAAGPSPVSAGFAGGAISRAGKSGRSVTPGFVSSRRLGLRVRLILRRRSAGLRSLRVAHIIRCECPSPARSRDVELLASERASKSAAPSFTAYVDRNPPASLWILSTSRARRVGVSISSDRLSPPISGSGRRWWPGRIGTAGA